jgi:hypothetical protein
MTCWFSEKNKGEPGYRHTPTEGRDFCLIRNIEIEDPAWTYCANHPWRGREKEECPIGPVTTDRGEGRVIWKESPDTTEIRNRLLEIVGSIGRKSDSQYPIGPTREEVVVWQLGEWKEHKALPDLKRVAALRPYPNWFLQILSALRTSAFFRRLKSSSLIELAKEAVEKIQNPMTQDKPPSSAATAPETQQQDDSQQPLPFFE